MSNILFYLLFAILLYFVLSRVFEKFSIEQENFDPSLVPVSSIVTLAKVAQKLVNGNGVLTNPGSLQIGGSSSAPGNLTVTGVTTINGNRTSITPSATTLSVTGNTTLGGSLRVTNATTVGGTLDVTGATTVGGTLGVTGATTFYNNATIGRDLIINNTTNGTTGTFNSNGTYFRLSSNARSQDDLSTYPLFSVGLSGADAYFNVTTTYAKRNLSVGNNLILEGNGSNSIQINARDKSGISQIYSDTANSGIRMYSNSTNKVIFNADKDGNLTVPGKLDVIGNSTVGGDLTVNAHAQINYGLTTIGNVEFTNGDVAVRNNNFKIGPGGTENIIMYSNTGNINTNGVISAKSITLGSTSLSESELISLKKLLGQITIKNTHGVVLSSREVYTGRGIDEVSVNLSSMLATNYTDSLWTLS